MGVLPFIAVADLVELGGDVVTPDVPVSIWPAGGARNRDAGRHHSHEGEAPLEHEDELCAPNRSLIYEGDTYRITEAVPHPLMAHVALRLTKTSGRS